MNDKQNAAVIDKLSAASILRFLQQLRQFGDAGRDLSRLILGRETRRSASAWLRLEVDLRHRKTICVADDIRDAAIFLDCPRWWEAALRSFRRSDNLPICESRLVSHPLGAAVETAASTPLFRGVYWPLGSVGCKSNL